MSISKIIAVYCENRRISARWLATRTGLPLRRVASSLYGRREFAAVEYRRVCAALGVSLDYFYFLALKSRKQED